MTTGVSAPMDFRYLRLVIPIFRTKKIKTAVRSSLFQAVGTTPFLGGEWGIRTPGTVIPYVSLANWWFQPLTQLSGQLKQNIAIVKRDKSKSKKGNYQIKTGEKFSPCILPGEAPRHGARIAGSLRPADRPYRRRHPLRGRRKFTSLFCRFACSGAGFALPYYEIAFRFCTFV